MKFISWNVNGLRACAGKGFEDTFNDLDADFFCLQETKMQPGREWTWNSRATIHTGTQQRKKAIPAQAIYSRHEPLSVTFGMGIEEHDHEGRIITLEMPAFYLVCVYTPNSQRTG